MMKKMLLILLVISLALNVYFIVDEIQYQQREEMGKRLNKAMGLEMPKTEWKEGLTMFQKKIKENNPELAKKKYYYINIWTTWCSPCIREMPWLDSIAGGLNKDVAYFFVSDVDEQKAVSCIKNKNMRINNFVFYNGMNDFVAAVCTKQGVKSKAYPMVVIINNKGEMLHYSVGAYGSKRESAQFAELIGGLE